MPISNATIKGATNPAINPSSYFSGVFKTVRDTFSQLTGSIKSISIQSASSTEISEMDEKLLNDIGLTNCDRMPSRSSDLSNHQHQRMYWY